MANWLTYGQPKRQLPQLARTRRNDLRLRAAGYTVLCYTWEQITEEPELVLADLGRALRMAA